MIKQHDGTADWTTKLPHNGRRTQHVEHNQQAEGHHHKVRIHIDRRPYESLNPTTGEALYTLGAVPESHQLYREVGGDEEDKSVRKGDEIVHLHEDEHFYSAERHKTEYTIVVNGRRKLVTTEDLTFAQIVALGFETPPASRDVMFTVTYRCGAGKRPDGTLIAGETVRIKDGTVFNVTATDKS